MQVTESVKKFIWNFVIKQKSNFLLMQFFALALSVETVVWPYAIKLMVEAIEDYQGLRAEIWSAIAIPVIFCLAIWLLLDVAFWLNGVFKMKTLPKFEADIRMFMYNYINNHSYSFFVNNFTGTIANKISDMPKSCAMITDMVTTTFILTFFAVITSITLFSFISPLFSIILGAWVTIHLLVSYLYARNCTYLSNIHSESRSELLGKIVDTITNNFNVRLFSRKTFEYQHILQSQKEEIKKHKQSIWYIEKMRLVLALICFLIIGVGMFLYEVHCFKLGIIDIADFIYILNTTFQITAVTWFAGVMLPDFFSELGVASQAINLIKTPIEIKDSDHAFDLKVRHGEIVFKDVTFHYQYNKNLFKNQNLTIPAGQKVGLVGASGSGKTTFTHLLLRNYDINHGKILIDNQNIKEVTQESLHKQIALISQEPLLFHRSIKENIRYGNLEATDEQVVEAAKLSGCHDFISNLPQKYETVTGERGNKLSGGQKQRISIARAILKNAPIFILDEATSALDTITELEIQQTLEQVIKNKTTLIIAHRLSTISTVDRILVFKNGQILEDGTHQQLIELEGEYYKLWNLQIIN